MMVYWQDSFRKIRTLTPLTPNTVELIPTLGPYQAKAAVVARMQALRESIMSDFHSNQTIGNNAGYLPPPDP